MYESNRSIQSSSNYSAAWRTRYYEAGQVKKWSYVMASVKAGYAGHLSQDARWPEVLYRTNCQIL